MGLRQPTIQNKEQKKLKLHARDGEDDTSYPPEKCGKHVTDFPKEKPAVKDFDLMSLFEFEIYTSEPAQVYEDLISQCTKEIQSCESAFDKASEFFKNNFEVDLEQKQPGRDSSYVIETVRGVQQRARSYLEKAIESLPTFKNDVDNYLKYRDGPLLALQVAENQYFTKIDEFIEIPNVEKLIKCLVYNVKDYKEIEHHTGLTHSDMDVMIFSFKRKNIFIPYENENTMDEEQYGESEMEDLLTGHKDTIKEICSLKKHFQTAKAEVDKYVLRYSSEHFSRVRRMRGFLTSADSHVRIMCNQLELLQHKDVILNGCDIIWEEDWMDACRGNWCPI